MIGIQRPAEMKLGESMSTAIGAPTPADVVLFVGQYHLGGHWLPKHCDSEVQIAPDLKIVPLGDVANRVLDACETRGENKSREFRQYGSLYALVRSNAPISKHSRRIWDPDRRLATALQISRVAKPTSIGYEYAARMFAEGGEKLQIFPADIKGAGAHAFILNPRTDGLRDKDVRLLIRLLSSFDPIKLPNRVKAALWMHEYLHWTAAIQMRWPLLVTGLESFVHVDERSRGSGSRGGWKSTDQFVNRLFRLREFVPTLRWSRADLVAIYELRSAFAHGRGAEINVMRGRPRRLYSTAERGLRLILQAAILKPSVAEIFGSDVSIKTTLGFRT